MSNTPKLKMFDSHGKHAGSVKTLTQAAEILFWAPQEFAECRYGHKKSDTLFAWSAAHSSDEAGAIQSAYDIKKIMLDRMTKETVDLAILESRLMATGQYSD